MYTTPMVSPSDGAQTHSASLTGTEVAQGGGKNHLPTIVSMRIDLISKSDPRAGFRADVKAHDQDGDEVTIRYKWMLNGEVLPGDEENVLEWHEKFKRGDELVLQAVPFDGKGEGVWKSQGSIEIPNSPPTIVSTTKGNIDENGVFTYQIKAEDPDGDPIEYALKDAPQGMSIDSATGKVSWNIAENSAKGEVSFTIVASDNEGGTATQELRFNIPPQE